VFRKDGKAMNNNKTKVLIKEMLEEKMSLGEILKELQKQHNIIMTFFDLKLLASEIEDYDWTALDTPEEKIEEEEKTEDETEETGKTIVEINKLARPGAVLHGNVKFASGATADWVLDQFGRLAMEKSNGQPTEEDMNEFKMELQKILAT